MIVTHITDPRLIATILNLPDDGLAANILSGFKCTRAEWVQYLKDYSPELDHDFLRVYGVVSDDKVQGYMVAINTYFPPLSRAFIVLYQTFLQLTAPERPKAALAALEKIKAWALEKGCHMIAVSAKNENTARLYITCAGFKKTEDIPLTLEF